MAATAISLHLRPNCHRVSQNPNFINFFSPSSSSHDTPPPPPQPQSQSQSQSSHSSYFNGLKASLKQSPPPQQQQPHRSFPPSFTNASSSKVASLDELRKNLSEYRRRTAAPPPNSSGQQPISFQELYKRNVPGKDDLNEPGKPGPSPIISIKQSLKQANSSSQDQGEGRRMLIDRLKKSFNRLPSSENSGRFIEYPSHLGSQMGDEKPMSDAMNIGFVNTYNYKEMGAKLRTLRPEVKGKNWFSLTELNERLKKLREIEDKEAESRSKTGCVIKDLKDALVSVQKDGDKAKESNSK